MNTQKRKGASMAKQHYTTTPLAGGPGTAAARAIEPIAEANPADEPVSETSTPGSELAHEQIARLAYAHWQNRGCPDGSPEEDWLRAEAELKSRPAGAGE